MPASKRRGVEKKANSNGWKGFVRCDLSTEQKEQAVAMLDDTPIDTVWQWFIDEVGEFKFSFSFDPDKNTATASMTGSKFAERNMEGYTLTARARTVERALGVLMYKHTVILSGQWHMENISDDESPDWIG